MAPNFTDEEVRAILLMMVAYHSLLVVLPSLVLAHLFGFLGFPKIRLATPFLVAVVATGFDHDGAVFYAFACMGMFPLLLWGRPRFLFGHYGSRDRLGFRRARPARPEASPPRLP